MMDDREVLPVNMYLGLSLPLVWKAWSRDRISLCCSRVVVSGKSILGFLHLLPSVVPPLLHPTSRLVVNFDMHDIKTSFI